MEIVKLVALGLRNKDIAAEVGASEHVIKHRLLGIFDKTGVDSRMQLALLWADEHREARTRSVVRRQKPKAKRQDFGFWDILRGTQLAVTLGSERIT
jgi:hypothetical protein